MTEDPNAEPSDNAEAQKNLRATALLGAVNAEASRFGVRQGQSIAEACALVANLVVREVSRARVLQELGRIAEMALAFGATASIEAPDTVWLDVTGSAHLVGGESTLASELSSRVRAMGHVARVAVADGPLLARAFARWSNSTQHEGWVFSSEQTKDSLAQLPVVSLPLDPECSAWLVKLGVITVGDLAALPRSAAAARLGSNASQVLELCEGRDDTPLVAYRPTRVLVEEISWDEPVSGFQPLVFVLKGLCSRLSARLAGRGEAAQKLVLTLHYDRSIATMNGTGPVETMNFELSCPLWREDELRRVMSSRLERFRLKAPSLGIRLETSIIVPAATRQLDLSGVVKGVLTSGQGLDELPVLLAELHADIGKDRVGVLKLLDSHRLEAKSAIFPVDSPSRAQLSIKGKPRNIKPNNFDRLRKTAGLVPKFFNPPSRLLPQPVRLNAGLRVGATLAIEERLYTIEKLKFEQRLDVVEWWSRSPISRDYVRVWLRGSEGGLEALVYVDRENGTRFVQAISD